MNDIINVNKVMDYYYYKGIKEYYMERMKLHSNDVDRTDFQLYSTMALYYINKCLELLNDFEEEVES